MDELSRYLGAALDSRGLAVVLGCLREACMEREANAISPVDRMYWGGVVSMITSARDGAKVIASVRRKALDS